MNANNVRCEYVNGLPEHSRLGLNASDPPSDDAESIDHRGMRICAHESIREMYAIPFEHPFCEVLEVHLMHYAYTRRHYAEAVERLGAPFQKAVTLLIPPKLDLHVLLKSRTGPIKIYLHRVVDNQIDGNQRLDDPRIFAHPLDGRSHRRQIYQKRDAGKILEHNPGDNKWDLFGTIRCCTPRR